MSDFDLTQAYQENHKYTLDALRSALRAVYVPPKQKKKKVASQRIGNISFHDMESYLDRIRSDCAKIFPSCQSLNFANMEPMEKFQYLKFFYYIGKVQGEWRTDHFKLFDCLRIPSERHGRYYVEMLEEILANQDKISLNPQVAREIRGNDGQGYADSLHTVQQWISHIAYGLYINYGIATDQLEKNILAFGRVIDDYIDKSQQLSRNFEFKLSCWDELCLLLAHNRDLYWEHDLLECHRKIYSIVHEAEIKGENSRTLMYPSHQFFSEADHCYLVYQDGNIEEVFSTEVFSDEDAQIDIDKDKKFLDALEVYVKKHIDELASKIFSKSQPTDAEKRRIINRFPAIREYWKMEFQRYNRNCNLLKSKLIAAYQVFFMSLPSSEINSSKSGTPKKREGRELFRESNALSSTYKNSTQKEPLYLQQICVWTDTQLLHYSLPPQYRELYSALYSKINIKTLESIIATDWKSRPISVQARAESILFLTCDTLTHVKLGIKPLFATLRCLNQCLGPVINLKSLIDFSIFEAYCKLFYAGCAEILIKSAKESCSDKRSFSVSLKTYSKSAIIVHNLALKIDYIAERKGYILKIFPPPTPSKIF